MCDALADLAATDSASKGGLFALDGDTDSFIVFNGPMTPEEIDAGWRHIEEIPPEVGEKLDRLGEERKRREQEAAERAAADPAPATPVEPSAPLPAPGMPPGG